MLADAGSGVVVAIVCAAVFGTSFISGVFGMAGGLILIGALIAFGLPMPVVMTYHGIAQAASNVWRALLWWRWVDPRILAWFIAGGLVAFAVFSVLRFVPDRAVVLIAIGILPFAALALPDRLVPKADRPTGAAICGMTSVGTQLFAGVSGPLLDAFFVRSGADRRLVVATKAACQFFGNLFKIVYFTALSPPGSWSAETASAIAIVVASFLGTAASRSLLERLTDAHFRVWTRAIVLVAGAVSLAAGLLDLADL
ncbi:TSUP family transporter [Prosthecomicrobium sp. N25]|uniref:TSUP family transporter n=1 Tax=Prosthecomicrobium sp. N25 TaxID=3129254 RepID=UPI003076A6FF